MSASPESSAPASPTNWPDPDVSSPAPAPPRYTAPGGGLVLGGKLPGGGRLTG